MTDIAFSVEQHITFACVHCGEVQDHHFAGLGHRSSGQPCSCGAYYTVLFRQPLEASTIIVYRPEQETSA